MQLSDPVHRFDTIPHWANAEQLLLPEDNNPRLLHVSVLSLLQLHGSNEVPLHLLAEEPCGVSRRLLVRCRLHLDQPVQLL